MQKTQFDWAVVGAGPAGIAVVGKLIDNGVDPKKIVWMDPEFRVGDFGKLWANVSSNTKVKLFLDFLNACKAFAYQSCENDYALHSADPNQTCFLRLMVEPLQWVTDRLASMVQTIKGSAETVRLENRCWEIKLTDEVTFAKNVVLAIGCKPKVLPFDSPEKIALSDALDGERLKPLCSSDDTVAVFGSSHSAILVIKELLNAGVKQVINFYLEPLCYAVDLGNWILFDDTGLKGTTAEWARENIDGKLPEKLQRYLSSAENLERHLPQCNKAVYAVGFKKRQKPVVVGLESVKYNAQNGIIAPGLFGVGIAFPECKENPFGTQEYRVGLWKFMDYLNRVLPVWLQYGPEGASVGAVKRSETSGLKA